MARMNITKKDETEKVIEQMRKLCSTNLAARVLLGVTKKMMEQNNRHLREIQRLESEVWYLKTCQESSLCPTCYVANLEKAKRTKYYSEKHFKYRSVV